MVYFAIVNLLWGFLGYVTAQYFDMKEPWLMFTLFYIVGYFLNFVKEAFKDD